MTEKHDGVYESAGILAHKNLWLGVGFGLFVLITFILPVPQGLLEVVEEKGYHEAMAAKGLAETPMDTAWKAKLVIALAVMVIIFFATDAMPIGAAALLIPFFGYIFSLDGPRPSDIAKNFFSDAAFFILGVLALGYAVAAVGLHSRIAALILGRAYGFKRPIFTLTIVMAMLSSFISAHALAAFLAPVLAAVYYGSVKAAQQRGTIEGHDRELAKMLMIALTYAMNVGGTGSPIAGGRNAIMMEYFSDYGVSMSFAKWMMYGFPMVPVLGLCVAFYVMWMFNPKVRDLTPGIKAIKADLRAKGPMSYGEKVMAGIMGLLLLLWIVPEATGMETHLGIGGPALLALLLPPLFRVVDWERMLRGIAWDAWFVYLGAMGLGAFMKHTGAAYWIASTFIDVLENFGLNQGLALWIPLSLLSGTITNFMSDGATTALLGPIALNMGILSGNAAEPWASGLAVAFSTSFAHFLIIGTPNNVIIYGLGRYPDTGERILHPADFVRYGIPIWLISLAVMWVLTFAIVFSVVGFPEGLLETAEAYTEGG